MSEFAKYLKDKYGSWGWMGQRAHDASGITKILPLDFIISCDYGQDVPLYFPGEDIFSVEKEKGIRKNWSNNHLKESFEGGLGKKIQQRFQSEENGVNLLAYRAVDHTGDFFNNLKMYAMPEKLKSYFDDKILLFNKLPEIGVPRIKGRVDNPCKNSFEDLQKEFGSSFVVQYPYGSSGQMTFFVGNKETFDEICERYHDTEAVILKYMEGYSLNTNTVIVSKGEGHEMILSLPSVQIVGAAECSNFPSAFCGNDFAATSKVSKDVLDQVKQITTSLGDWMAQEGYRGIFGVDIIVSEGKAYPIEINPRFQNSTSLYTSLEVASRRNEVNLFLVHAAEFLQEHDAVAREYIQSIDKDILMEPLKGAQLILHNDMKPQVVTGEVKPGIYSYDMDEFQFIREAATIDELREGDILITCSLPEAGTLLEANAPICKMQFRQRIMDENNKDISLFAKHAVSEVYKRLSLEPKEEEK